MSIRVYDYYSGTPGTLLASLGPYTITGGAPAVNPTVYAFGASAPPYKLSKKVKNTTNTRQKYRVDSDGNGSWDTEFELAPGEEYSLSFTSDTAPTHDVTIQQEAYLGDAQWAFADLETITPSGWTQTSGTPTTTFTYAQGPNVQPDTTSSNTNAQKVTYTAPTGGGVQESTFKTGVESLRSTSIEASDKTAAAIDKLRKEVKHYAGFDDGDPNPTDKAQASKDATASAVSALTSAMGTSNLASNVLSVSPPTTPAPSSFWEIPLPGGDSVQWDAPELDTFFAFGKAMITWAIMGLYLVFALWEGWGAIKTAMLGPQAVSSSTIPGFSSGIAIASALLILAAYAAMIAAIVFAAGTIATNVGTYGAWTSFSMASPTGSGPGVSASTMFDLAEKCIPIRLAMSLFTASVVYHFTVNSTAVVAMATVRGIAA